MCAGVVDEEEVSDFHFRKHAVDRKFIVVLAQGACYVIFVIARLIFFSHHRDVVVSAVHCRSHQVDRACITADILFVNVFLMDCARNESAVRSHHETAHFRVNCNIAHAGRNENFIVHFMYTLANHADVIAFLIRFVRNSDAAGKIDEFNLHARLFLQLYSQLKQCFCQNRVVIIGYGITCKEGMNAELFCPFCLQNAECLKNLLGCHTVFGISRIIHDVGADFKQSARVITAADFLRNVA